jgi:hypothetical protein
VKCQNNSGGNDLFPQHDAANPMLHGWDGILRLASLPLFPPNITMVIMANSSICVSSDQRIFLQKTIVWLFYGVFCASSLLSSLSGYVDIGLVLLLKRLFCVSSSIFTRFFAAVLGLICTFRTKVRSSLGHRTRLLPERYFLFVP